MRVLLLSDFFQSGQTTHVLDLAQQLEKLGVQIHLAFGTIHSKLFKSQYAPQLRANNISFSHEQNFGAIIGRASKWKPDLIHCQSSTLFHSTQYLALQQRLPFVLTCHGLGFRHPRYRMPFRLAAAIIAIGPKVADELTDYQDKVTIIPNGVNSEHFRPEPSTMGARKKILYVGRLEEKRIPALQRLAKAHQTILNQPLTIISDWNPNLPHTQFTPWQVDVVPHLQRSGIVAACGRTAREALSCGNVVLLMQQSYDGVVSPQLVSSPDFDFSGNLGRFPLYEVEKDLRTLLKSSSRLKKLQSWGRKYAVSNLSSLEMAKQTLELYNEVLKPNYLAGRSGFPFS